MRVGAEHGDVVLLPPALATAGRGVPGLCRGAGPMPCPKFPGLRQDVLTGEVFIQRDLSSPTAGGMPVPQNSPGSHRVPFHQAAAFYHFNFIFILFFSNVLPYSWPMAAQHHWWVPGQAHATPRERAKTARLGSARPKSAFFFYIYINFEADELAMCLV